MKLRNICLIGLLLLPSQVTSSEVDKTNYPYLWGKVYQTSNNPTKNRHFARRVSNLYGKGERDAEVRQVATDAARKYTHLGYDRHKLSEFLYRIALHESNGGKYTKQINGPARSWFQIEPTTAVALVKKYPELIKGFNISYLQSLTLAEMASLLERRQDIAASIAIAKIIETGEKLGTNESLKG